MLLQLSVKSLFHLFTLLCLYLRLCSNVMSGMYELLTRIRLLQVILYNSTASVNLDTHLKNKFVIDYLSYIKSASDSTYMQLSHSTFTTYDI